MLTLSFNLNLTRTRCSPFSYKIFSKFTRKFCQNGTNRPQKNYKIQLLTENLLEESLDMMRDIFFREEIVCRSMNMRNYPEAIKELLNLPKQIAKDGISVVALDPARDNRIASVLFNKIMTRTGSFYEQILQTYCKHSHSRAYMQFFIDADNKADFYNYCNVDVIFDHVCTCTRHEYRGQGLQTKMSTYALEIAEKLARRKNVEDNIVIDGVELKLHQKPEICLGSATSKRLQKLYLGSLGFEVAAEVYFRDLMFQGKPLDSFMEEKDGKEIFIVKRLNVS